MTFFEAKKILKGFISALCTRENIDGGGDNDNEVTNGLS